MIWNEVVCMGIIQMSISASILILVVILVRQFAIHRLPKKTFMILWCVVILRLLIPFAITLPTSAYNNASTAVAGSSVDFGNALILQNAQSNIGAFEAVNSVVANITETTLFFYMSILWIIGAMVIAAFFLFNHFRSSKEYKASLPVDNFYIDEWLKSQTLMRHIHVRQSDKIAAPLTYGIWKPVILFPKTTDWQDVSSLQYVLTHELTHIRRFDILTKWLIVAALCVHWFNPLVWAMYFLVNRDIELSCDEAVIQHFGESTKSAYAMALIGLEERRSMFSPLCTYFSKNSIEERVVAIMKIKTKSILGLVLAVAIVSAFTIGTLVVFANDSRTVPYEETYFENFLESIYRYSSERNIVIMDIGFDGNPRITIETPDGYAYEPSVDGQPSQRVRVNEFCPTGEAGYDTEIIVVWADED